MASAKRNAKSRNICWYFPTGTLRGLFRSENTMRLFTNHELIAKIKLDALKNDKHVAFGRRFYIPTRAFISCKKRMILLELVVCI